MAEILLAERQADVLEAVIREYVRTAEPVSSAVVAGKYRVSASSATIRNDMTELEAAGFIRQPHTSAGRVPTEQAYRYYVGHFIRNRDVPKREADELHALWSLREQRRDTMKRTAKAVAAFSAESVFLAFGQHDVYYTGLSNLFAQPEFARPEHVFTMSVVIDQLDDVVAELYGEILQRAGVGILVGRENPFGRETSAIVARCGLGHDAAIIFGLLGPTRMDYDTNVARVRYVSEGLVPR